MHTAFRSEGQALASPSRRTEVSLMNGVEVPYGTAGSVRLGVVQFEARGKAISVFDLMTGSAVPVN